MSKSPAQISTTQLMFSVGCYIQGSIFLTFPIHNIAKQDAWIGVLIGFLISLPIIWIYTSLAKRFPGKSLMEINDQVLGNFLGKIFSALYVIFFFGLVFLNLRSVGDFVGGFMLPITPMLVVLIMLVFVCCWAVRKGVTTMTRYATLFVIVIFMVIIFNSLLLIGNIKLSNLLPWFTLPPKSYLQSSHTAAMLMFCEVIAFFMLFPNLSNARGSGKALWGGVAIGVVTMLFNVARDTAVFGQYTAIATSPTFLVIRLIDVGTILTRMEVLYAITIIMVMFFKISVLLYAAVFGTSQLLKFDSYRFLVYTFAAIAVIFALVVFNSSMEHATWLIKGYPAVYATLFEFIMPAFTLIVAVMREQLAKDATVQS